MTYPTRYKKQDLYSEPPKRLDQSTEALQTIGMRIRKAVADGYQVPSSEQSLPVSGPHRSALPDHLQQPPSLMFGGSTVSSLGDWQNEINVNNKRKLEDYDDPKNFQNSNSDFLTKNRDLQQYERAYDTLRFDEDF